MNEEKETQSPQESETRKPTEETASLVERAEEAAKRIEEENNRYEELVRRNEEAKTMNLLGGKSNAGEVEEVKEETEKDYADKILSGKTE